MIELDRPWRSRRRDGAKSDSIDAVRAAREPLGRQKLAEPRSGTERAGLAVLLGARRSAVKASTDAQRQLQAFVVAAPETLAAMFRGRGGIPMPRAAPRLRIDPNADPETLATATVLRSLARRALELIAEAEAHKAAIKALVRTMRPDLLELTGVGPIVAASVLCARSHPGRCRSEAAFAKLGEVAPLEASSGQTARHRLNRYGDRQLNRALHTVVLLDCAATTPRGSTPSGGDLRARMIERSSDASSATCHASSTDCWKEPQLRLDTTKERPRPVARPAQPVAGCALLMTRQVRGIQRSRGRAGPCLR
ncbi:MAG: transposase [Acidimicrobiales bacterium]